MSTDLYSQILLRDKLNIERLEQCYGFFPSHVYFIDTNHTYLWANEKKREDVKAATYFDIIGRTNFHILSEKCAQFVTDVESAIIHQKPNTPYLSIFPDKNQGQLEHNYLEDIHYVGGVNIQTQSVKTPVLSPEGESKGLLCFSTPRNIHSAEINLLNKIKKSISSDKQAQCLYLMIKGYTASKIAKALTIPKRTIESYIHELKTQFKCTSTPNLIEHAVEQFLYNN